MKKCNKCNVEKELTHFNIRKISKDGYRNECKECRKEYEKENQEILKKKRLEYNLVNKEKRKEYNLVNKEKRKEYLEKNSDSIKRKRRKKYIENRQEELNSGKEYREKNKEKLEEYFKKTKEHRKLVHKAYREKNKEKISEQKRIYYTENKDKIKEYKIKNKDNINIYQKNRKNTNPVIKLSFNVRSAISSSLKRCGFHKNLRTQKIIGCTVEDFKMYLESKFEPWMSWENYGLYNGELNHGWDLDHIIPIKCAVSEEDVLRLNYYINFQPLCSKINRDIKKDNYPYTPI